MDEQPSGSHSEKRTDIGRVHQSDKRPYVSPRLTAYGTLARLTRNGAGSGADGGGTMSMQCL